MYTVFYFLIDVIRIYKLQKVTDPGAREYVQAAVAASRTLRNGTLPGDRSREHPGLGPEFAIWNTHVLCFRTLLARWCP